MKTHSKRLISMAVAAALGAPLAAHATNGMNLEAYGPIAGGMGGASMAYDNGTAAMMNNTATLSLMDEGNRLDVAVGNLRPKVTTEAGTMSWDSSSDSFMMPAIGWANNNGNMTYGFGIFAQGGMGTEYGGAMGAPGGAMSAQHIGSAETQLTNFGMTVNSTATADAMALTERSEVSVGRMILPLSMKVNDRLTVGGSVDFVWAGMDLQMAMPGSMMMDMMPTAYNPNATQAGGTMTGTLVDGLGANLACPVDALGNCVPMGDPTMVGLSAGISALNYGYFDFTDSSPYTGKALGTGFAAKLGLTYKMTDTVTLGATYHSKTNMSDLTTSGANVDMSVLMHDGAGNNNMMNMSLVGEMSVNNFQWPATMAVGLSIEASDALMIAADVKRINWSGVMSDFSMTFTADNVASNNLGPGMDMRGASMDATMYQDWDDQTVMQIGAAYALSEATVARVGYNRASQPIPDSTMHYLFPAITETHYTFGLGHAMSGHQDINFSMSYVPETTVDNPAGFSTSMSQLNWQFMYSHKF